MLTRCRQFGIRHLIVGALALTFYSFAPFPARAADPYETYINTSKDFQRVPQKPAMLLKAFPSWTYMPWTFQWSIGYTADSGKWSLDHGYNGAFIDHGDISGGKLDWINQFHLRFYMDHTAQKHFLHLWDGDEVKPHLNELHSTDMRPVPLNAALKAKLEGLMKQHIDAVKSSPYRAAYALDDEISWGHFIHPTMWQITDDKTAFPNWLKEIYGPNPPAHPKWISYNDILPKLSTWSIATFDASPLMDQWTFNDSCWNNFIGDLVEYSNQLDPETPCGFVGGQAPNAFGGYDYAKIMRKVQFIESYNQGSSQAIIRSFNPQNAIPAVTTQFHKNVNDSTWQTWYYLAHGNKGFIGWVEGWFDGKEPKPFHDQLAPTLKEAANKIGPLLSGSQWKHDGIAIYYSHPSIQLGWILDAQAHGKTWVNRNGDEKLGASHLVRHAWENMLRDEGLQYNFISYADVVQTGIPKDYKVLILPACLALSDIECQRIKAFAQAGGTVIADYLPALWDQHGKGRASGGALDDLFGVKHDPQMTPADLFSGAGKLWCEVDQDANFTYKSYDQFLTNKNFCIKDASGFDKAVRNMAVSTTHKFGQGSATLLNLSPQWYNAYRSHGLEDAKKRATFMASIHAAGVRRWVDIKEGSDKEFGYEFTYWTKGTRTIVCLTLNPEIQGSSTGGGNSVGLKTAALPVTIAFSKAVKNVRNERTGDALPAGADFAVTWKQAEGVVLSFDTPGGL